MKITNDMYYVGVNDHQIDLFEGQYIVPNGMSYNSYVITDEKIAVMDTVDIHFRDEWLNNIESVLNGRKPDYLIISHMEPDHSANIKNFLTKYPDTIIVGNMNSFKMLDQFFVFDIEINKLVVKEYDRLNLGTHELMFVFAPMVHWPEVMMTYDMYDKVLFSADAFGKFGANDIEEKWDDEARRYYFGIVGKYGLQVQNILKKISKFDIQMICSLHGPILKENLKYYLYLYDSWSSYNVEVEGILIAYASIYGNTKKAAEYTKMELERKGIPVIIRDLARVDMHEVIANAFKYSKLILASSTYNADVFPPMKEFINHLVERNYQNRTVAFIENGSWAPTANKVMKDMLSKSKNITYINNNVTIKSTFKDTDLENINKLITELI